MTCLHGLPGEDLEYLGDALLVLDHAELDEQARQAVLVVLLSDKLDNLSELNLNYCQCLTCDGFA